MNRPNRASLNLDKIHNHALCQFWVFKTGDALDIEEITNRIERVMRVSNTSVRVSDEKITITSHFSTVNWFVI